MSTIRSRPISLLFALVAIAAVSVAPRENSAQVHTASGPTLEASGGFLPTIQNPLRVPANPPACGMVWIPGGEYKMGSKDPVQPSIPGREAKQWTMLRLIHRVYADGFWMDKTDVTNAQFERFAKATGYITVAERRPNPKDFPGCLPASWCLDPLYSRPLRRLSPSTTPSQWWSYVPGANWRHPLGPGSSIQGGKPNDPVCSNCLRRCDSLREVGGQTLADRGRMGVRRTRRRGRKNVCLGRQHAS